MIYSGIGTDASRLLTNEQSSGDKYCIVYIYICIMGLFNLLFNEPTRPINIKYTNFVYNKNFTPITVSNPPCFFDDRYKNRLLKLKQNCYCCFADSNKK